MASITSQIFSSSSSGGRHAYKLNILGNANMRVYMAGSGRGALAPALGPPLAPTEVAEEDGKLGI